MADKEGLELKRFCGADPAGEILIVNEVKGEDLGLGGGRSPESIPLRRQIPVIREFYRENLRLDANHPVSSRAFSLR